MFSALSKRKIVIIETFNLSSANAFNLVTYKNFSFGKGLMQLCDTIQQDRHHFYRSIYFVWSSSRLDGWSGGKSLDYQLWGPRFDTRPGQDISETDWLIIFVYLSSIPVAHLSDAPRRRLVFTGDSARIQDETTENSAWFFNVFVV